jgi:excisionase family DNA binding protein
MVCIIFNELQSIKSEQQSIKQFTLLGVKQALTMSDAALLTGLSKSHLYKLVCAKQIPYYKSQDGKQYLLDRGTKLLLLNILKKGYIDDNDISLLSKKIVFNINLEDWIPVVFNQE